MDYRGSFFALRFCIALLSQMSLLEQFVCFLASDVPKVSKRQLWKLGFPPTSVEPVCCGVPVGIPSSRQDAYGLGFGGHLCLLVPVSSCALCSGMDLSLDMKCSHSTKSPHTKHLGVWRVWVLAEPTPVPFCEHLAPPHPFPDPHLPPANCPHLQFLLPLVTQPSSAPKQATPNHPGA